jgi:hypothetical protein
MVPNTGTESRNVDVMTAKNIRELRNRNTDTLDLAKAGNCGGANG